MGSVVAANSNPNALNTLIISPQVQAEDPLRQLSDTLHPSGITNVDAGPKSDKNAVAAAASGAPSNVTVETQDDPLKMLLTASVILGAEDAKKARDNAAAEKMALAQETGAGADDSSSSWVPAPILNIVSAIKNYARAFFPDHSAVADLFNQKLGRHESKAIHSSMGIRTPAMQSSGEDSLSENLPSFLAVSGLALFSAGAFWLVRRKKKSSGVKRGAI